jgi:hypothetical protein
VRQAACPRCLTLCGSVCGDGGIIRIDLSTQHGNALVEVQRVRRGRAAVASLRPRFACIASTRLPVSSHTIPLTRCGPTHHRQRTHSHYQYYTANTISAVPPPSLAGGHTQGGQSRWWPHPPCFPYLACLNQSRFLGQPSN